ncbi:MULTISPECIES: TrbI F-type domain-containing protein [Legionellaceae]|uniref:F pilus extension/retraction protein TrbI Inner membrane protein n=1 Tax=Legionella bozemanae TaxID=447 RepID=A0A0W0R9H9_LEGBO|nr:MULTISPECIES: TrbI F-type domain-containing protein [Legionellaceae]KTC67704.1 F pilus extension/retraction protein TrbI Inner membrane protein [Legionella bozemanae]MCW8497077.1 TrbI F-type domain-containing protein [Fluoribacter dumoffii]STO32893.1 type-F conjugative transfer system protein TrbI [Legionella bozemanae]
MRLVHQVSLSVVALILIGLELVWTSQNTQVVLFDTEVIQAQLVRQLAEHQANEEQVSHTTRQFKNKLQNLLTQYAKQHHVIILDHRKVLAGGEDITYEIVNKLGQAMRNKS